jgi:DnaJ-class molecular chaperone
MPRTCRTCNGKGYYSVIGEEPCSKCAGSGRNTRSNCWAQYCTKCNGKGRVPYARNLRCRDCGGTGKY